MNDKSNKFTKPTKYFQYFLVFIFRQLRQTEFYQAIPSFILLYNTKTLKIKSVFLYFKQKIYIVFPKNTVAPGLTAQTGNFYGEQNQKNAVFRMQVPNIFE